MAVKLNLLPPELAVDKNLGTVLKLARSLGIIVLAAFILFVVGVSGFFVYDSIVLKNLTADVATVTNQIKSMGADEQQIVLLKDRIKKISSVKSIPTGMPNLIAVDPFISNLSSNSSISSLNVDPQKIELLINFKTNDDLSSFLKSFSTSTAFKTVTLTSFSLNPTTGYSLGLTVQAK